MIDSQIRYTMQRVSDGAWVTASFGSFDIRKTPQYFRTFDEAFYELARCAITSPKLGKIQIREIKIETVAAEVAKADRTAVATEFLRKLGKAYATNPTYKKLYRGNAILFLWRALKLYEKNKKYQYVAFVFTRTTCKIDKKLVKYKSLTESNYLIKSTADLITMRLHDDFRPYFIYDIVNDDIVLSI